MVARPDTTKLRCGGDLAKSPAPNGTSSGARPLEPSGAEGPDCGWCAEGNGVGALDGSAGTVRFTKAYEVFRGENGELAVRVKKVCTRCQDDYPDRSIFAPDANGEPGGSWGDK